MFVFLLWWILIYITLYENAQLHWSSTKTQFYEFLVIERCISLYMHFLQSLIKFQIFRIEGQKYLLFIYLVLNAAFIPIYHVKAVQDDISSWTIAQWLRNAVLYKVVRIANYTVWCNQMGTVWNLTLFEGL